MIAFANGVAQFFAPTHLLAIVALGLLSGQQAIRPVFLIVALTIGLAAGSAIVASAIRESPAGPALLILASVTAAFAILDRKGLSWATGALALVIGASLALNAPPQEFTVPAAIISQFGFGVAALTTFALAALPAARTTLAWHRIGVRIVASWIAASAILVLALRLVR